MANRHARAEIAAEAFTALKQTFRNAVLGCNPSVEIPTPFWAAGQSNCAGEQSLRDVVADGIGGVGDEDMAELLVIVGTAAKGEDASLRALAWIQRTAEKYAELNCDDMAHELISAAEC
jgi:hypothetical protein